MAKKAIAKFSSEKNMDRSDYELTRMNYREIKRACIARGMPFEQASDGSIVRLASWFKEHYDQGQNLSLLDEYDAWIETELISTGRYKKGDAIFHSSLKMGFIGNTREDGTVEKKKPRLANKGLKKKEKSKRERIEGTKIFKGTKKALTYQSQKEGLSVQKTIERVIAQFPEAQEKSIKIWYKRSQNNK